QIAEGGTRRRGRHPRQVDVIFDGERHTVQGAGRRERIALELTCPCDSLLARRYRDPDRLQRRSRDLVIDCRDHIRGSSCPRLIQLPQGPQIQFHHLSLRKVTSRWPADTSAPGTQFNISTMPALGAATAISIFIASNTMSFCPA